MGCDKEAFRGGNETRRWSSITPSPSGVAQTTKIGPIAVPPFLRLARSLARSLSLVRIFAVALAPHRVCLPHRAPGNDTQCLVVHAESRDR